MSVMRGARGDSVDKFLDNGAALLKNLGLEPRRPRG